MAEKQSRDSKSTKDTREGSPAEDPMQTVHLYGPLAGSIISMPLADAQQAISDGWARDANDHHPAAAETLPTPEETQALIEKANIGVAKLRGEPIGEQPPLPPEGESEAQRKKREAASKDEADRKEAERNRASTAQPTPEGGYKTRASTETKTPT